MRKTLRSNEGLGPKCSVSSESVEVCKQLQLKWEVLQVSERKKIRKLRYFSVAHGTPGKTVIGRGGGKALTTRHNSFKQKDPNL